MWPKPAHPVQEDFDFLILLNIILFVHDSEETFFNDSFLFLQFWGVQFYFGFRK